MAAAAAAIQAPDQCTAQPISDPVYHPRYLRSEVLGNEITELCGYIYAATYQLLVKIRLRCDFSSR